MTVNRDAPYKTGRGDGLEVEPMSRNPEGRGSIPHLGSRRLSLISIEHAELLRSTPSYVLCCAWLVTMALHVRCGLGQLRPLPTSGDDKWVAAKHCGRAKRSRISDTHRLRSSLQFRYINNQSLLFYFIQTQKCESCQLNIPTTPFPAGGFPQMSNETSCGVVNFWTPSPRHK